MKIQPKPLALALLAAAVLPAAAAAPARPTPAGPVVPQDDDEEKPDKRPEVKELLDQFKDHVSKRGDEDAEAIAIIDKLLQEFPESGPKDREDIAGELADVYKLKRKQTKEGILDNKLFLAATVALGEMGPESVKDLAKWSGHKNFDKNSQVRCAILKSIGKTQHEDGIDTLVDFLTNHEAEVQAAAAEALGNYGEIEQKKRKEIFKEVLDEVTRLKNIIDVDQVDPIERRRYDVVAGPMLTTLQVLSGQDDIRDPSEFRTWWNKNKKKDWDEGNMR